MVKSILTLLFIVFSCHIILSQEYSIVEHCLTKNKFDDRYASYSPDGEKIVFESNRSGVWQIYTMDKNGQQVKKLSHGNDANRRPSWHPDGSTILYESIKNENTKLKTKNIKTNKESILNTDLGKGQLIFAEYSPSGEKIAASLTISENNSHIVILNKVGQHLENITNNIYRNYYPRWSENGNELIFFSRKQTNNEDDEIYRFNQETREEIRLTTWPKHNFCPSWSPDNKFIAYVTSMEDSRPEIYIMQSDGSHQTRVTHNDDGDTLPNWHPTENKLLITAYREGNYQICELELLSNE